MSALENDDIMADIRTAMTPEEEKEPLDEADEIVDLEGETKEDRPRDENGKFAKKEVVDQPDKDIPPEDKTTPVINKPRVEAPISMPATVKAKWETLPEDVQQYWSNREADIHRMMTAPDGELRIGREMKEALTPYTPMFQHLGVAPKELVSDLMNKVHLLNTGSPDQKVQLLHHIAQQYGVDLSGTQPEPIDPKYQHLERQIQQLSQMANPQAIEERLQTKLLNDKVSSEIEAFASNPKNVYYDQVKTHMGSLFKANQAKDLQDAYDQACWANPNIRSTMLEAKAAEDAQKRRLENEAKRKAGASVNGSPSGTPPAPKAPNQSIEDDIRSALREASGVI